MWRKPDEAGRHLYFISGELSEKIGAHLSTSVPFQSFRLCVLGLLPKSPAVSYLELDLKAAQTGSCPPVEEKVHVQQVNLSASIKSCML